MKRGALALATALFVAACGGNTTATTQPASSPQGTRGEQTQPAQAGEPIDAAAIQAAATALKTGHDSFQFQVTTFQSGTPNYSQTITGTQRVKPQPAVSATHNQPNETDFHYVRIGDDIWFDVGTGTYTKTTASEAGNLIVQYEPYYLDGLVDSATAQGYEYNPVGSETVNGIATTHYRLSDGSLTFIVDTMKDITAADWAADAWISDTDGSLIRLTWGPQSLDKAQLQPGFEFVVTAIDCACPVDPPTASAT